MFTAKVPQGARSKGVGAWMPVGELYEKANCKRYDCVHARNDSIYF